MIFLDNESTSPFYNLALEEYFFKRTDLDDDMLILWRNEPTVVVGRHQNTFDEIDEGYVRENGIHVVRRNSGGGAVYHDLGNLNFSIIQQAAGDYSFARFAEPVITCLDSFGVHAEHSGRNDITVEGRKFSGNAQYLFGGKILHHGTILFSGDLDVLAKALKPEPEKIRKKGVASVRSRVANLSEYLSGVSLEDFRDQLVATIFAGEHPTPYSLSDTDQMVTQEIAKAKYRTPEWNYGQSPAGKGAQIRTDAGTVGLWLETELGVVQSARITGDFFAVQPVEELCQRFIGVMKSDLTAVVDGLDCSGYIKNFTNEDMNRLIHAS